jgi:hypothetical protein
MAWENEIVLNLTIITDEGQPVKIRDKIKLRG